jgi:hypothetical protein
MKYPKIPTKPYAPYKPQPPAKQIEQSTRIGSLSFDEDSTYSLQSFEDFIKSNSSGTNPSDVKFSWEIEKEPTYYDETIISLKLNLFTVATVDNPQYDRLYKYYEEQLVKYEKDYQKYRDDLKQYKIEEIRYKEELEAWTLQNAKDTIKRLESKVKGKKK